MTLPSQADPDDWFPRTTLSRDAFLGGRLHLYQPRDGYRASADSVFLASACPARPAQRVLELGCGGGAASLCLHIRVPVTLCGIERQRNYANLARRNAADNNIEMEVVAADLMDLPSQVKSRSFDHVILNPPYYGPGKASRDPGRNQAMHEDTPLEGWIDQALKRLKPKGHLTMIHMAERLQDILIALNFRAGAIEIKPLAARTGRPANRVIIRAQKGAAGELALHNPLILHAGPQHLKDRDDYTPVVKSILRDAQPLEF